MATYAASEGSGIAATIRALDFTGEVADNMPVMRKLLIASVLFLVAAAAPRAQAPGAAAPRPLDIYFIDVEGGQATLFVTPSGESMLIDTGHPGNGDRDINRVLATIKQAGLTKLDYLLVTHYHSDHVGNAAAIAAKIPVGMFVDHGDTVETGEGPKALYEEYLKGRATGRHMLAKPQDKVPIRDLDVTIVTAGGKSLTRSGQGTPNPLCASFTPKETDSSENAQSVGSVIAFGRFRMLDLGDLTWNKEHELVCPTNLIGPIDVYLTTHHGLTQSGPEAIVHALKPRVAIMNNGPKKGGAAEAMQIVRRSPGLEDFWQLHYSVDAGKDANMPEPMIANLDESTAHYIKLSAQRDGAFTVTNARTKETRTYKAPNLHGRPAAFSDFRREVPGAIHKITVADLPAPRATRGVNNPPTLVARPAGALPKTIAGYAVSEYASGLDNPRLIRTAPNGDLFVAESDRGRVPQRQRLRGGARLVEPQSADRLQSDPGPLQGGRHGRGLVRGLPHGVRHRRRVSVGTAGRGGRRPRWIAPRQRRRIEHDLARGKEGGCGQQAVAVSRFRASSGEDPQHVRVVVRP
jgi:competence protein ComEC